jgi:Uma2 family endonuclease
MAPAPAWQHQELSIILAGELRAFLKGKPCRPFAAPTDVFLPEDGEDAADPDGISTVVQPDLGVVCDPAKISQRGVTGAPDVVMEIISPASVIRDFNLKKELYSRHGCREYWIWDARLQWVTRYVRTPAGVWDEGNSWAPSETAESVVLAGFRLSLPALRDELGIRD